MFVTVFTAVLYGTLSWISMCCVGAFRGQRPSCLGRCLPSFLTSPTSTYPFISPAAASVDQSVFNAFPSSLFLFFFFGLKIQNCGVAWVALCTGALEGIVQCFSSFLQLRKVFYFHFVLAHYVWYQLGHFVLVFVLRVCFLTAKQWVLVIVIYSVFCNKFYIFMCLILVSQLTLLVRNTSPLVLPRVPCLDWVSSVFQNPDLWLIGSESLQVGFSSLLRKIFPVYTQHYFYIRFTYRCNVFLRAVIPYKVITLYRW
jgi:hypothetical protein